VGRSRLSQTGKDESDVLVWKAATRVMNPAIDPKIITRAYERDPEAAAWVTYVPALDHLSTFGETRDEALENTREAILGYLEAAAREGLDVPEGDAEAFPHLTRE